MDCCLHREASGDQTVMTIAEMNDVLQELCKGHFTAELEICKQMTTLMPQKIDELSREIE